MARKLYPIGIQTFERIREEAKLGCMAVCSLIIWGETRRGAILRLLEFLF